MVSRRSAWIKQQNTFSKKKKKKKKRKEKQGNNGICP
jgi:hypothetical protein